MSYHELTGVFCKESDYQDLESIQLACMLHKETLKETYDLESILQQYEEEAKTGKKSPKKRRSEKKVREKKTEEKWKKIKTLRYRKTAIITRRERIMQ